jgi:two-component system, OmpR family, sensor kinase
VNLRARLIGVVALVTVVSLGGSFASVATAVNRAQERQLDEALRREAEEEAREISAIGGTTLAISDRPGPAANDVGPLTKYAAIYDRAGTVLAATATFGGHAPALERVAHPPGATFDLRPGAEPLRGVFAPIPGHPQLSLLLAAPRTDLDGDEAFLARAMTIAFVLAVGWSVALATWFMRRLTREYDAVAEAMRRVADGDLEARVAATGSGTIFRRDVDEVLARLRTVAHAQRRFIANAAHELRSPLTALYGEVTLVLRKERSAAEHREALEEVLDATGRLNSLADELLTLARLGAGTGPPQERVDLAPIARAVAEECAIQAEPRGVTVRAAIEEAHVRGRASELERVLRNLLDNALAHSPDGTSIALDVSATDRAVRIAVTDEGPGVPAADRERIFEPFFRGGAQRATERGGVGLGLAIVCEIVRAHGGSVSLADRPEGAGARFEVELPGAA